MTTTRTALALLALALVASGAGAAKAKPKKKPPVPQPVAKVMEDPRIDTLAVPSAGSPLVAVRLLFRAGSIDDPAGKEGLAALTGLMLGQASTAKRSYGDLVAALYPIAASIEVNTDREVTTITGEVHRDNLATYTSLLLEAVTEPAFTQADFERNREQLLTYLTNTLRGTNDELLGLEAIQGAIFPGHPYAHSPAGTVQGLKSLTLDDVKGFYKKAFTRSRLLLGVAGGYPEGFIAQLKTGLAALPLGAESKEPVALPAPAPPEGRRITLIEKPAASVGLHLGFPLPLNRADADFYPLLVAVSALGEHRTSYGRLYGELREKRGLNYGDYAYLEYYESPPVTNSPTPGVPRRQQYFSIWLRPVVPVNAQFALRGALFELDRLIRDGLSPEEFELTRSFMINYSKLWGQTLPRRLGFAMDSRFYGMSPYLDEIDRRLSSMKVEEVNRAIKKYLQVDNLRIVLVTANAADLKAGLERDLPVPMKYNSEVPAEVLADDELIQRLKIKPASIEIVPVDRMFEK
ncbi:MAG TPA: pitrilysin family protein [Thermoanaerobaculia bacterium]|nr:pitrilysin family protein [Thermoanaerobaculia bacterium]